VQGVIVPSAACAKTPGSHLGLRGLMNNCGYTQSMSKRLQVLLAEQELAEIRRLARRERLTVAAWVRRALDEARQQRPAGDPARKIASIRAAAGHDFPSGDIESMLADIARGQAVGPTAPPPPRRRSRP
jgi:hypothetical protein